MNISEKHDLPSSTSEQVVSGSLREVGQQKSGPALVSFIEWIATEARADGVDHLLFMFPLNFLQSVVGSAKGCVAVTLPPSSWMIGGRRSLTVASLTPESFDPSVLLLDVERLTPVDVLERIGVPAPSDHVLQDVGLSPRATLASDSIARMRTFLTAWRWEILKVSQQRRRDLFRHLLESGLSAGCRVAIVDVGWNGETQEALETALLGVMPLEMIGYNFCLSDGADCRRRRRRFNMKAFVDEKTLSSDLLQAVYTNRAACEFLLAPSRNTVIDCQEKRQERLRYIETDELTAAAAEVEAGIRDFVSSLNSPRHHSSVVPNPIEMVMPLLKFVAGQEWVGNSSLERAINFHS